MSQVYHNGLLHTNSSYFAAAPFYSHSKKNYKQTFTVDKIAEDYKAAIDHARAQEIGVYQSFFPGVTEYEVFIQKLRELFSGVGNLRGLSNASLKSDIIIKNEKQKFKYHIIIDKQTLGKMRIKANTDTVELDTGELYLSVDNSSDLQVIKQILNHIKALPDEYKDRYDPFNRAHVKNTTKFGLTSARTEGVERWLDMELQAIADKDETVWSKILMQGVQITRERPDGTTTEKEVTQQIAGSDLPFSRFRSSDINNAIKHGDTRVISAVNEAREEAKEFLRKRIDASSDPDLNKAFNLAWSKLPTDFFFEGNNIIKGVLGNPGEFALDVAMNYVAFKTGSKNSLLSGIIGDIAMGKRGQPRSDYELLTAIGQKPVSAGIQVKNVDKSGYNDIEANTDLGLMAPNLGENITTSIANYKFNASIAAKTGDMEAMLGQYLNDMIWRGLNFNVKDGLIPEHTNTFYFLGGTMIVPVSRFIMYLGNPKGLNKDTDAAYITDKAMEPPETTISGLTKGTINDAGFETPNDHPLFLKYWHGNEDIGWTPQSSNEGEFQNLLGGIRVKSVLKFASFLQVSGGASYYEFL